MSLRKDVFYEVQTCLSINDLTLWERSYTITHLEFRLYDVFRYPSNSNVVKLIREKSFYRRCCNSVFLSFVQAEFSNVSTTLFDGL